MDSPAHVDPNEYSPAKGVFHLGCLIGVAVLVVVLGRPLLDQAGDAGGLLRALGGALAGLLIADLMSGVAHWIFDTYGDDRTPILGKTFIMLFRVHHSDPLNITHAGFVRINGDNSMLAGAFLLVVFALGAVGLAPSGPFGIAAVLSFAIGIAFTNMFHQWSHKPEPPAVARALHRLGLVLTPAAHARHHTPPFRTDYCITFGWLNPLLERVRFFRRLEGLIASLAAVGRPQARVRSIDAGPPPRAETNRNAKA